MNKEQKELLEGWEDLLDNNLEFLGIAKHKHAYLIKKLIVQLLKAKDVECEERLNKERNKNIYWLEEFKKEIRRASGTNKNMDEVLLDTLDTVRFILTKRDNG